MDFETYFKLVLNGLKKNGFEKPISDSYRKEIFDLYDHGLHFQSTVRHCLDRLKSERNKDLRNERGES